MKISNLDDLPKYSTWPARLLGLEHRQADKEMPAEEKWAALLEKFMQHTDARLEDVDAWASDPEQAMLASVDQHIVEMTGQECHDAYIAYIASALEPYLPAPALVELGCGYGSVILGLARKASFQDMGYFAADLATAGPALASRIAERESVGLIVGHSDLRAVPITDLKVPEGALVYTAYASHKVEPIEGMFIEGLRVLKPSMVVHIEPVYEHCDPSTLLGLLRQRYIQVNGYNRNLSTILHDHEAQGSLEIIHESVPGFGPNPLLAASVIAWKPRG